jgi:hypothetical protein
VPYPRALFVCEGEIHGFVPLGIRFYLWRSWGREDDYEFPSTLVHASHPWLRQEWGPLFLAGLRFSSQRGPSRATHHD